MIVSCCLFTDPLRTTQGYLSLKAYRLTPEMMKYYGNREHDFSPDSIKEAKMSFEKMFEEIPVVIKNSHLVNSMLCELEDTISENKTFDHLDLGTR